MKKRKILPRRQHDHKPHDLDRTWDKDRNQITIVKCRCGHAIETRPGWN